jgi:hypothetical protein
MLDMWDTDVNVRLTPTAVTGRAWVSYAENLLDSMNRPSVEENTGEDDHANIWNHLL